MNFAQKLRAERKRLGISQPQLAEILEVSFRVISNWEREFSTPPAITQEGALARLKGISKPRENIQMNKYNIAEHWDPGANITAGADPVEEFEIYKACKDPNMDCGFTLEDFEKYIDSLNEGTEAIQHWKP